MRTWLTEFSPAGIVAEHELVAGRRVAVRVRGRNLEVQQFDAPPPAESHAVIWLEEEVWVLRDLSRLLGVFLNGRKIQLEHVLADGDLIEFGLGGPIARFAVESGVPVTVPAGNIPDRDLPREEAQRARVGESDPADGDPVPRQDRRSQPAITMTLVIVVTGAAILYLSGYWRLGAEPDGIAPSSDGPGVPVVVDSASRGTPAGIREVHGDIATDQADTAPAQDGRRSIELPQQMPSAPQDSESAEILPDDSASALVQDTTRSPVGADADPNSVALDTEADTTLVGVPVPVDSASVDALGVPEETGDSAADTLTKPLSILGEDLRLIPESPRVALVCPRESGARDSCREIVPIPN